MQYGYKTFQNVTPILHSVICSEMNTVSVTNKRLLLKERGSYKFIFFFETVNFYCKTILQFTLYSYMWSFMFKLNV